MKVRQWRITHIWDGYNDGNGHKVALCWSWLVVAEVNRRIEVGEGLDSFCMFADACTSRLSFVVTHMRASVQGAFGVEH